MYYKYIFLCGADNRLLFQQAIKFIPTFMPMELFVPENSGLRHEAYYALDLCCVKLLPGIILLGVFTAKI